MRIERSRDLGLAVLLIAIGVAPASAQVVSACPLELSAVTMSLSLAPTIAAAPGDGQYAHSAFSGVAAFESTYGHATNYEASYPLAASPVCTPAPACIPTCVMPPQQPSSPQPNDQSPQTNQRPPAEPAANSATPQAAPRPAPEPNLEPVFIDPDAEPSSPAAEPIQRLEVARPKLEALPPRPAPNAVRPRSTSWTRTTLRRQYSSPDGWRPVRK